MRVVDTVIDGLTYRVQVPEGTEPEYYSRGLILGPPDLSVCGWPEDIADRVHVELYSRGIISKRDAAANRQEIALAIISAMQITVDRILECYNASDTGS